MSCISHEITPEVISSVAVRFWAKVDRRGSDECWPWLGARDRRGYGRIKAFGRNWVASRIVLALKGSIPSSEEIVCHHCDNPPCCNPEHLFIGTALLNAQDRAAKGREPDRRGEGNGRAKLTADQVREIRANPLGHKRLAEMVGVSPTTIRDVRSRRKWSHVA